MLSNETSLTNTPIKKCLYTLMDQIWTLAKISRLAVSNDFKRKIRKSYFHTVVFKRMDARNKTLKVVGYKLSYLNYETFPYLFQDIFVNQEYYFIATNNSPVIIDCGSNIGMSILYFKLLYPNSRIIAFEPDEDAYRCLKKNVEQNGLQGIELNNQAVSESEGETAFYYDVEKPGSLVMGLICERMPKQKRPVEAVHLSKYLAKGVDFLKMDIEGVELGVIQELNQSGKLRYVNQMAIEYHHHIIRDQDVLSRLLGILENAGFGYQISTPSRPPLSRYRFQDILIYAYQKNEPFSSLRPVTGTFDEG